LYPLVAGASSCCWYEASSAVSSTWFVHHITCFGLPFLSRCHRASRCHLQSMMPQSILEGVTFRSIVGVSKFVSQFKSFPSLPITTHPLLRLYWLVVIAVVILVFSGACCVSGILQLRPCAFDTFVSVVCYGSVVVSTNHLLRLPTLLRSLRHCDSIVASWKSPCLA
jgi:hypothetical protein